MAIGTQFLALKQRLRAELGRSVDVSVGVDDDESLKQTLNRTYAALYMQWDWPHLRMVWPHIQLSAGQRFYDFPVNLNPDRVEKVVVRYNGHFYPLDRGIDFDAYNAYDSEAGERSDPALRWDVRWTGSSTQFEIWPVPVSDEQSVQFRGIIALPRLVDDTDVCLLDDELVVLFAAQELLSRQKSQDADKKLQLAQEHFNRLKGRSKGASERLQLGLGPSGPVRPYKAVIRVR